VTLLESEVHENGTIEFAELTPLDRYLAEQADLTAVGTFARSRKTVTKAAHAIAPLQERYYSKLLPLRQPKPGEQYAFSVDLDTCTGCKACVTACHSLNGLDDDESWRTVGLLHLSSGPTALKTATATTTQQTVTSGCHHCVDPACLKGCPVDAYEKDPLTGIVKHLDDQCIGCGYCMLTCPYEVPRYSASRGIVRKCDMCADRLADGEAPACVQACPNSAITITVIDKLEAVARSYGTELVPGAPKSSITAPTTVYKTTRDLSPLQAADLHTLRPAEAHPPLAIMLVLTQLSVGAFLVDVVLQLLARRGWFAANDVSSLRPANAALALALGMIALGASVLHLGRPQFFYRAVIGVRHSWLSREIVAFGGFAAAATIHAAVLWKAPIAKSYSPTIPGLLVGAVGLVGVGCSVMIYTVTGRVWWKLRYTGSKFVGTTATCGVATVLLTSSFSSNKVADNIAPTLLWTLIALTVLKLFGEAVFLRHARSSNPTDRTRTARLLLGALWRTTAARFVCGIAGGIGLPVAVLAYGTRSVIMCALMGFLVAVGEFLERYQFFRAVSSPRMPGALP
jgi:formate dehydrogenase iron-sulfur subunit